MIDISLKIKIQVCELNFFEGNFKNKNIKEKILK